MKQLVTVFWRSAAAALCWLALGQPALAAAQAGEPQPLEAILQTAIEAHTVRAADHGYEEVRIVARPLDQRLRLPRCDQPLTALAARSSTVLGPVSTGVRCSGSSPWTIYVRLDVTAVRSIPVLARALPRHARIEAADLKQVKRPLESVPNGVLFDVGDIIGMELERALSEGATIRASQLRQPKVVRRGDQVTLVSGTGGLKVSSQGKALGDATPGERVSVENTITGVTVEGIAGTDGTVTVP